MTARYRSFGVASVTIALVMIAAPSMSATLFVDIGDGSFAADGSCSLREAVANANSDSQAFSGLGECAAGSGADDISLTMDVTLTEVDNTTDGSNGLPAITSAITIDGGGYSLSRDGASPSFRLFYLNDVSADLSLGDLTVNGGDADTFDGGAVRLAAGRVTADGVTFSNNQATFGGAIYRNGSASLIINRSRFLSNHSSSSGGAINIGCCNSGTKTVINSLFDGNDSDTSGGALSVNGTINVVNTTFVNNDAVSNGGAINVTLQRPLSLYNSTITNNTANNGGGLYAYSSSANLKPLSNTIISGNSATSSGDDCGGNPASFLELEAQNNVFGSNGSDGGCSGFAPSSADNLIPAGDLSTVFEVDAFGDPFLSLNGGLTETVALVPGGPAVNAGDSALSPNESSLGVDGDGDGNTDDPIDHDQRADGSVWPRTGLDYTDAGAFELPGDIYYVDADAIGGNDTGESWSNAFVTLFDALSWAGDGDEVWIAEGAYYPDLGIGQIGDSVTATFTVSNGVRIYGGFAGSETQVIQGDVVANVVVLSGDVDGDDIVDLNGVTLHFNDLRGNNAEHVITADGTDTSTVLDGLTITAGDGCSMAGAGIVCIGGGGPTLRNLTVIGNRTACGYNGGGVSGCSSSIVESSLFANNDAIAGGAWEGGGTFTDVAFSGNRAGSTGGAMFGSGIDMMRCSLVDNFSLTGGAIRSNGDLRLETVLISGNRSTLGSGGGVYTVGSGTRELINVTVTGNHAGNGDDLGGGIYNGGTTTLTITSSILWNNSDSSGVGTLDAQITNVAAGPVPVSHSILQASGGSTSWLPPDMADGGNNLDLDPFFVSPVDPADSPTAAGDFHISTSSPAADAGDNAAVTTATDLDGAPRIQDGLVDIGPYEGPIETLPYTDGFESGDSSAWSSTVP